MNRLFRISALILPVFLAGCALFRGTERFDRFFVWNLPGTEEEFRLAAECGVTDGAVYNLKQILLAKRYRIRPFRIFVPIGPKGQVLTPEEEKRFEEYRTAGGLEKPTVNSSRQELEEYIRKRNAFYRSRKYRHGGEPEGGKDILTRRLPCPSDPENHEASLQALRKLCRTHDADGIAFDFCGYTNYRGCFCEVCQAGYRNYLKENRLRDTPEERDRFSLKVLTEFINMLLDCVKEEDSGLLTAIRVYPVFLPNPLYGDLLKADICGETVSGYFLQSPEKIAENTQKIFLKEKSPDPAARIWPFVGFGYPVLPDAPLYDVKTPARLEMELKTILENGGRNLMLGSFRELLLRKEYRDVLQKYVRPPQKSKLMSRE